MNKWLFYASGIFLFLLLSCPSRGQTDVFKGLFGKEAPSFHSKMLPGGVEGAARMALYFTHSKLSELEVSVWIKDHGPALTRDGNKRLIRGLKTMGNRRQDTIYFSGLTDQHFYTIGVDYRNPKSLSRTFDSEIVIENYRYDFQLPAPPQRDIQPRTPVVVKAVPPPAERPPAATPPAPCREARLSLRLEPSGFCQDNDRPAVMIQCTNCEGRSWDFSVEARAEYGDWRPLRTDGQLQTAFGTSLRTEPLCILAPGKYYVRVLAWGEGCKTPTIQVVGASIMIPEPRPSASVYRPTPQPADIQPALPESCTVDGRAILDGAIIRGGLRLEAGSPCAGIAPYAEVHYIHPGYRDLTIQRVPLKAGEVTPFQFELDEKDLTRSVHPIEVIVFSDAVPSRREVPLSSFWVNTDVDTQQPQHTDNRSPLTRSGVLEEYSYSDSEDNADLPAAGSTDGYASSLSETIDTIGVVASDPNCNGVQNLEMYYHRAEPEKPVFISWLSPRCCQRKGCDYTVWAGPDPQQLRLLVEGSKPGATVSELLQGLEPGDQYFEVVVSTANGDRKAAYVLGEGPLYGFEEIIAYRDRLNPPTSDPLVFQKGTKEETPAESPSELSASTDDPQAAYETTVKSAKAGGESADFAWDGQPAEPLATGPFQQPKLPIETFTPCQYRRDTEIISNRPIRAGDSVELRYDHDRAGYKYSLYYYAEALNQWVIAPGTTELQASPTFLFQASPGQSGRYIVLSYKPSKGWGCLSDPLDNPIKLNIASK